MGGLLDGLGVGYSGIATSRAGVQTTGHNITNANTPGFHRRRVEQSPVAPYFGGGVVVDGVQRIEDRLLGVQIETSAGRQGYAGARQDLLVQVEGGLGKLGEGGLGDAIAQLFTSFSQLTSAPADPALRGQVLSAAQSVARGFNGAAARLQALATAIDDGVDATVAPLNQTLARVAELNATIVQIEAAGGDAGDLRDQRQQQLGTLATQLGVKSFDDELGQTTVLLDGMTLVQGDHAATLAAVPDVALGGRLRIDLVDGASRIDVTARLGGALGGQIAVRDGTINQALGRLDQLANDLATAVNAQHAAGFGLDGSTGLHLFTGLAAVSGSAAQIGVNGLVGADQLAAAGAAPGLPGDGANALALAGLSEVSLAAGGSRTAAGEVGAIVGWVGGEVDAALGQAQAADDELMHLSAQAASSEGVSLDEEMVRLVQYQRSYEASARFLHTVDSLLARLMEI